MDGIRYRPIGVIHSPFTDTRDVPIQPVGGREVTGTVEVAPEYADGLEDLDGFSHVILLYHFHLSRGYSLRVKPFLDDQMRGVFATRAPRRPNPIGLSAVRLRRVEGVKLHVSELDIVDGTPLLDIKPFVPGFDHRRGVRVGWLTKRVDKARSQRSDSRFD